VPVILIFTKFESQEAVAFRLLKQQHSTEEALSKAPQQARDNFDQEHLSRFTSQKYAPKGILYLKGEYMLFICIWISCSDLQDMDKDDAVCPEIVELTVELLNGDTLKTLLATVQQTNTRLRVQHMFKMCSPA
jgi:hypothetical protein